MSLHDLWRVKVSTVDHDGVPEQTLKASKIEGGKFLPIRQNQQGIGPYSRLIWIFCIGDISGNHLARAFRSCRVESHNRTLLAQKRTNDVDGGRLANVIGTALIG